MKSIDDLRHNDDITELLCDICDIYILPQLNIPQNENGHLTYNILGMTFARNSGGSEYILLEDGSIGYWGSDGRIGRIADSLYDFFELIVNCPYWIDYVDNNQYQSKEKLQQFAETIYKEHVDMFQEDSDIQLDESKKELSAKLNISLYENVVESILIKFYNSATRLPHLIGTYSEDDGSKHSSLGSLFEPE